jgi:hypothetical protein
MQEKYSVEFHFEDFRSGFREGRRISGEMDLYRQKYCGCVYSEMERYTKTKPAEIERGSAENQMKDKG